MDSYITMRRRFANTFRQIVDFHRGVNRSPRCQRISSILLMDSVTSVLCELTKDFDCRLKSASTKPRADSITPQSYKKYTQSLYNLAVALNHFFDAGLESREDLHSVLTVLKSLMDDLEYIEKLSRLMVHQKSDGQDEDENDDETSSNDKEHEYWFITDEEIQSATTAFLKALEINNVKSIMENPAVSAFLEKKSPGFSRRLLNKYRSILKNIQDGNKDIERKLRNDKDYPMFDASKPYDVSRYMVASEEDAA